MSRRCATCRWMVPVGTNFVCHGAPPTLVINDNKFHSYFPFVNPNDVNFWCALYRRHWRRTLKRVFLSRRETNQ